MDQQARERTAALAASAAEAKRLAEAELAMEAAINDEDVRRLLARV